MNKELEKIVEIYNSTKNKRSILNVLRSRENAELTKALDENFPMLSDERYSTGMKVYWLVNGISDFPKCAECGKPNMTNRCTVLGYATDYCSNACAHGRTRQKRMEETFMRNLGTTNPLKDKDVRKRQSETVMKRYGVDNVSKLESTVEKIRETKLERYGDKNFVNREKAKATNLERYGSDNPFGNRNIQTKARKTMLERYGADSPMHVREIRDRVSEKTSRFAVHNSYANFLMANRFSRPNFTEEFYLGHRDRTFEFEFRCLRCGGTFTSRVHNGCVRRCPKCWPSTSTSAKEQELFEFVRSIVGDRAVRKDRTLLKGMEVDIAVPDMKVAFEFDGNYWHSEQNGVGKDYHLDKTERLEREGYRLVHVFEDEWDGKREIVESRVSNIIGVCKRRIYARKCKVVEVSPKAEMEFLSNNHLQGFVSSSHRIGLEHDGELVALMTFSKPRIAVGMKGDEGTYELLRLCTKVGTCVVGGAAKMLKSFEENVRPRKIVSYADRRWSQGDVYQKLGFRLDHVSRPNYWYLPSGCSERHHRFSFRKSVLSRKLKTFDPDMTEAENMMANGYTRIWDCGNLVFVKNV